MEIIVVGGIIGIVVGLVGWALIKGSIDDVYRATDSYMIHKAQEKEFLRRIAEAQEKKAGK